MPARPWPRRMSPGAQIAIVDRGKLVWSAAYGLRRRDPALPMNPETTTWAASITKSLFSTYVMQLVERGEFSLDTPIAKLLPQPLHTYASKSTKPKSSAPRSPKPDPSKRQSNPTLSRHGPLASVRAVWGSKCIAWLGYVSGHFGSLRPSES